MDRITNERSSFSISRLVLALAFLLVLGAARPWLASATTITVNNATDANFPGFCNFRQAIYSHNHSKAAPLSSCSAGTLSGNDTIDLKIIGNTVDLANKDDPEAPLTIQGGSVEIKPDPKNVCYTLQQAAYLTVDPGATMTLTGISVVVNGAASRSAIDNNGGTLTIQPNGTSGPCLFSNRDGIGNPPLFGGVLFNHSFNHVAGTGIATIVDASLSNSSARDNGGAIYVDSGTVTIQRGSFNNNKATRGGAIYVGNGGTLNVKSSNFTINNNSANNSGGAGGAIYSDGGNVSIQRDPSQALRNVQIASNGAVFEGGAIFANGGKLSIDGIQFLNNFAPGFLNLVPGNGGAIELSNFPPSNPASITRTYFRGNLATGKGGSIYATDSSTLMLSSDTFRGNLSKAGGIFADKNASLGVINSTFLGTSGGPDGINVESGKADVTFSTIVSSNLSGPGSGFSLSSSVLRDVTCTHVTDDLNNLRNPSSPNCPGTNDTTNPTLGLDTALKDNGGFTPTIMLLTGSPAIDAIPVGDCLDLTNNPLKIDQRDAARPDPTRPTYCDTGAVESESKATSGLLPPGTPLN